MLLRSAGFPRPNMIDFEPFANAPPMTAPTDQLATERRKEDGDIDARTAKAGDDKVAASTYTRDILECDLPPVVLDELLKDRTTGKNIIWATDDYAARGPGFAFLDEIAAAAVSRRADPVIRPRVDKPKDVQKSRVREKAEIFTPAWICNNMINLGDRAWFGRKTSPFNREVPRGWVSTWGKKIHFPKSGKNSPPGWQKYVAEGRLEITCGEGPFLASRYDAVTGEMISVPDRIGILDRKLRVAAENCADEADWIRWAKRALQGTYGFEWQGDNLLLARENVLADVVETHAFVFRDGAERTDFSAIPLPDLVEMAEIVSWNLWQMDGFKGVVPKSCHDTEETNLLGEVVRTPCKACENRKDPISVIHRHTGEYCKIVSDWSTREVIRFVDILPERGPRPPVKKGLRRG